MSTAEKRLSGKKVLITGKRDSTAAERFWSPNYVQRSPRLNRARDGLFNLIRSIPTLRYEPGIIVPEGDFVVIRRHERAGDAGPRILAA
jgi:hypothetical protein